MLKIVTKGTEIYNSVTNEFESVESKTYYFEHSLYAIFNWEGKYRKPFMSKADKSYEEILDYISMMCTTEIDIDFLDEESIKEIIDYVGSDHTATSFKLNDKKDNKNMVLTSEVLYAYMAMANIPFECDRWNISRLMTVLRVYAELNSQEKKMSKKDVFRQNKELNKARRENKGGSG